jgi:hypothetical protein
MMACVTELAGCSSRAASSGGERLANPKARETTVALTTSSNMKATIRRLGATVEIEVTSNSPLGAGAMPPVLVIGDRAFGRSRNPPDGRLETLIFTIDASEFDALSDSSQVSVGTLHPSARLSAPPPAGGAQNMTSQPLITPQQVAPNQQVLGRLRKATMDVAP